MATHTEFKLAVTALSLEEPEYRPCAELQAICQLIEAPTLTRSPAELYPSNQPIRCFSERESSCFLSIDINSDPTDQMSVVEIQIRCLDAVADQVNLLLCQIRNRSEIETALLRGDLGLCVATDVA